MRGKPPKFSLGKDIQNCLIYFFIMVFECRKALSDSPLLSLTEISIEPQSKYKWNLHRGLR